MATFNVTNTNDSGAGSLREAIDLANAQAGLDTVLFTVAGQIDLLSPLVVTGDLIIDGDGPAGAFNGDVILDGNGLVQLIDATNVDLTLMGLTLQNANTNGFGGAVEANTATVIDTLFQDNVGSHGGGLYTRYGATIINSTFINNTADVSYGGGFVGAANGGVVTIINSTFAGNQADTVGGAIDVTVGELIIHNSTITGNSANFAGGISAYDNVDVTITNSILSGNWVVPSELTTPSPASSDYGVSAPGTLIINSSVIGTYVSPDSGTGNFVTDTPNLGPVQDNGGSVPFMAPLPGSVALGNGTVAMLPADTFDLDGDGNTTEPLPLAGNGAARVALDGTMDIGAYQTHPIIVVDSAADGIDGLMGAGQVTLREALAYVETGGIIRFADNVRNMVLTEGALQIDRDVTIEGFIDGDILPRRTIDANAQSRIFEIGGTGATQVHLDGLNLINGRVTGNFESGGAIVVEANGFPRPELTITNSVISNSSATNGNGGAISTFGLIHLYNTSLIDNFAKNGGGAVQQAFGSAGSTYTNVTFAGNVTPDGEGGAIYAFDSHAIIRNSTITNNRAMAEGTAGANGAGGGIYNEVNSVGANQMTITNSVIWGNTSGVTPAADDVVVVRNATPDSPLPILEANNSYFGPGVSIGSGASNTVTAADPLLGPLSGNQGYTTRTFVPQPGSPLIGAGNAALLPADTADLDNDGNTTEPLSMAANGTARVIGGSLDIGAAEIAAYQAVLGFNSGPLTAKYGNLFQGSSAPSGRVAFDFQLSGPFDTILMFQSFDIDNPNEVGVFFNGHSLGNLAVTGDGLTKDVLLHLPKELSTFGDNIVEFVQLQNPTYQWGVTNVGQRTLGSIAFDQITTTDFGNQFNGRSNLFGKQSFLIDGTDSDLRLVARGYDIDTPTEVEILLDSTISLGFMKVTPNNGFGLTELLIPEALIPDTGKHLITFVQRDNPTFRWGVDYFQLDHAIDADVYLARDVTNTTNLGNKFMGTTAPSGTVSASFHFGAADRLKLSFDAFDIDGGAEVEYLVNGNSVGFLPSGVDNGLKHYDLIIPIEFRNQNGENLIEFRQAQNLTYSWGVTNMKVTAVPGTNAIGGDPFSDFGNKFNGLTDADGIHSVAFANVASLGSRVISFEAFDIDNDHEVEVILNGRSLGFLDAGVDGGFSYHEIVVDVPILRDFDNLLQFRQAQNPTFQWGIRDLSIDNYHDTDFRVIVTGPDAPTTDSSRFGFNFGPGPNQTEVSASFNNRAQNGFMAKFKAFDVDTDSEVGVTAGGGTDLLPLLTGVDNGLQDYRVLLPVFNSSTIREYEFGFKQLHNPIWSWGITDLSVEKIPVIQEDVLVTQSFGRNFNGAMDADGLVSLAVASGARSGDVAFMLDVKGFDIDTPTEVEVIWNGKVIGNLAQTANNGFGDNHFILPIDRSDQFNGNLLEFRQTQNPAWQWGVTDIEITTIPKLTDDFPHFEVFGHNVPGQSVEGTQQYWFEGTGSDMRLYFEGYDVDNAIELGVFVNGAQVAGVPAGINNGFKDYDIKIPVAAQVMGLNTLEIRQIQNPTFIWGAKRLLIDEDGGAPNRLTAGETLTLQLVGNDQFEFNFMDTDTLAPLQFSTNDVPDGVTLTINGQNSGTVSGDDTVFLTSQIGENSVILQSVLGTMVDVEVTLL